MRIDLVFQLAREHQQLSWETFRQHSEQLLRPHALSGPLIVAQDMPEHYWRSVPLAAVESWARAHVPAEMSPEIERGMERARFRLAEKTELVRQADALLR
jgi:hypothetical protein